MAMETQRDWERIYRERYEQAVRKLGYKDISLNRFPEGLNPNSFNMQKLMEKVCGGIMNPFQCDGNTLATIQIPDDLIGYAVSIRRQIRKESEEKVH